MKRFILFVILGFAAIASAQTSPGVPNVAEPVVTSADSSTVTASPDVVSTGTISSSTSVSIALSGRNGVGVTLVPASLSAIIVPEISFDNGATWIISPFINVESGIREPNITVTLTSTTISRNILTAGGATNARVRLVWTAGSVTIKLAATAQGIPASTTVTADYPVTLSFSESVAAPTAATWYLKRSFTPNATPMIFLPKFALSHVTTAGSRTIVCIGRSMGSFNVSTNVFTRAGTASLPSMFYSRLFGIVTTVMSAVANTVTVTYTDYAAGAGRATAARAIAASAPVGNAFEFVLAATTGQQRDVGATDVTAVVDTAAPTGILEIWGCNPMLETLGISTSNENAHISDIIVDTNETVYILLQQVATTAEQRGVTVLGTTRFKNP